MVNDPCLKNRPNVADEGVAVYKRAGAEASLYWLRGTPSKSQEEVIELKIWPQFVTRGDQDKTPGLCVTARQTFSKKKQNKKNAYIGSKNSFK
jgi:hypothetical protein